MLSDEGGSDLALQRLSALTFRQIDLFNIEDKWIHVRELKIQHTSSAENTASTGNLKQIATKVSFAVMISLDLYF